VVAAAPSAAVAGRAVAMTAGRAAAIAVAGRAAATATVGRVEAVEASLASDSAAASDGTMLGRTAAAGGRAAAVDAQRSTSAGCAAATATAGRASATAAAGRAAATAAAGRAVATAAAGRAAATAAAGRAAATAAAGRAVAVATRAEGRSGSSAMSVRREAKARVSASRRMDMNLKIPGSAPPGGQVSACAFPCTVKYFDGTRCTELPRVSRLFDPCFCAT
jgi:hypothetical protein